MTRLLPIALLAVALAPAGAADEPIFEPDAKLKTEAGNGSAGEGPAWDPMLGVLTSGKDGIHQLTRDIRGASEGLQRLIGAIKPPGA